MKKLYSILGLGIAVILLMANSSGRGSVGNEALTMAPGEAGNTCGKVGCHAAGAFTPSVDFQLVNSDGEPVDSYQLGVEYTARLSVQASGSPSGYGFQMVAVAEDESSAGQWGDLPSGTQELTLLGRSYVEHGQTLSNPVIEIPWMADEDAGDVSFFFVANAVNGNGSPGGDGTANGSVVIESSGPSSVGQLALEQMNIYPNPAQDYLQVENSSNKSYLIIDELGQVVTRGFDAGYIDLSELAEGLYFLRLQNGKTVQRFIKI